MAAVGGMGEENSVQETDDSPDKPVSVLAEMCKRNGVNHSCHCGEKSCKSFDGKRHKPNAIIKLNGVSKNAFNNSLALTSGRAVRSTSLAQAESRSLDTQSQQTKRRLSKSDRLGEVDSDISPKREEADQEDCVNNNTKKDANGHQAAISGAVTTCRSVHGGNGISLPLFLSRPRALLPDKSHLCTPPSSSSSSENGGFIAFPPPPPRCGPSATAGPSNSQETKPADLVVCLWTKCGEKASGSDLLEHIRTKHVLPQQDKEHCRCFWVGCKVYDKPSSSHSWLERHIITHSGDKPYCCIVDGCGCRFTSQSGLERHVNSHFNTYQTGQPQKSRSKDDTPSKAVKKRKLKRKRPWLIKTNDYFDSRIMENLTHQVREFEQVTSIDAKGAGRLITFHSSVIARRTEESGKVKVLLHYKPEDILPDEWVPESEAASKASTAIPLSQLPRDTVANLYPSLYIPHRYRKHRRK